MAESRLRTRQQHARASMLPRGTHVSASSARSKTVARQLVDGVFLEGETFDDLPCRSTAASFAGNDWTDRVSDLPDDGVCFDVWRGAAADDGGIDSASDGSETVALTTGRLPDCVTPHS